LPMGALGRLARGLGLFSIRLRTFLVILAEARFASFPVTHAHGKLLLVPFISPLLLLANSAFSTLSAPYDRPCLIPPPLII
jgi:hypothetical protein